MGDLPPTGPWVSPDCRAGKHAACSSDAWNDAVDAPTPCEDECHGRD